MKVKAENEVNDCDNDMPLNQFIAGKKKKHKEQVFTSKGKSIVKKNLY